MPSRTSLFLTAPETLRWKEDILSAPTSDEVLVRTLYGAISIGTELPLYLGASRSSTPPHYSKMTGYESYGMVEACGPGVTRFKPGDRVVGFYGHRTHALEPQTRLIPISKGLDPRLALLIILSCDVKKGIVKLSPKPGEAVLITGAGAIGLLTLFVLRALGVTEVDVAEPLAERRALAERLGARSTLDPAEPTPQSYQLAFECSSRNAAFTLLQDRLEPHGRLCVLADGNLEPLVLSPQFHEKELRVVGSSDGLDYQKHAAWFYGLEELDKLEALFELEIAAREMPRVFAHMTAGKIKPIKALVRYS